MIAQNRGPARQPFIFILLLAAMILSQILESQKAHANVVGSDAQNFNPSTSGLDFITVQSSETLKPGIVNLGLFLNYAVNTLPYYESSTQSRLNFNDSLLGMDLNAGIGLAPNWDVGLSLPQILRQSVSDQNGARGEFAQTGATEVRLNTKYRLFGDDRGGMALVASLAFNRIQDNPYSGDGAGPSTLLEAAFDTTIGRIALGGNVGYRFRSPGQKISNSLIEPLKNSYLASAAASYHVPRWNTKFISEVFASWPAQETTSFGERAVSSAELLAGAKHDLSTNLALHAGFGTEVLQGLSSPDWRVYTGLNYTFGPVFEAPPPSTRDHHLILVVPEDASSPGVRRYRTQKILFEFDSDRMIGDYAEILAELAEHLKKGFSELVIEGHTDSVGPAAYNQTLSLRRAEAIKKYLLSHFALDSRKIMAVGYGETRPIADNGNYQGRQENRRVDFVINNR